MTIMSEDDYIASLKKDILFYKFAARTTVATAPFSVFDLAGNPGAGTLAIGNTANGTVPTDETAGYPLIADLTDTGYLGRMLYGINVPCYIYTFDRLFAAGAYSYNADTTLASQPSYQNRVPSYNYNSLELWIEAVTAFTGTPSIQINYLDQDGNAGDTGVVAAPAALTVGRCFQMPLASGDSGIQQVTRVRGTVASAGTFNVMVLRQLYNIRCAVANDGGCDNMFKTGLKRIYGDSALYVLVAADSTSSGYPYIKFEICDK